MPGISVIVPAFNEAACISRCLKSIRAQKDSDYELIVVDNASNDATRKLSEKYADRLVETKHRGTWRARNAGARAAHSRLLVFIDADTTIPRNYLSAVRAGMRDKEISGLSCAFRFKERSTSLNVVCDLSNKYLQWKGMQGKGELLGFNCAMRKETFLKAGGFPDKPMEDGAMARRLWKLGRVIFLPFPKVETSARRMKHTGMLKAIEYYASLSLQTTMPGLPLNRILRYKKYFPVR